MIQSNDDRKSNQEAAIQSTGFAPGSAADFAMVMTLHSGV
jgi:hypothetical protein